MATAYKWTYDMAGMNFTPHPPMLYWVSPTGNDVTGDGTNLLPWATWAYAATQATVPGDVIHGAAGTYTETAQIVLAPGVDMIGAGITTIITTATALDPIILLSSASEGINGNQSISYIKIDGNLTAAAGIGIYARKNVVVHHCEFIDLLNQGLLYSGLVRGSADGAPAVYPTGNDIYNNSFTNCGLEIYSAPYYFATGALYLGGQANSLIYNNTIDNVTGGRYGYGIKYVYGGYNKGLDIYDNTILISPKHVADNQWSYAIEFWNQRGGMKIHNNTIQGAVDMGSVKRYMRTIFPLPHYNHIRRVE